MTDTSKLISFVNNNLKRFFIRNIEWWQQAVQGWLPISHR